eukprot:NODE_892_length_1145_cov_16.184307_g620_i0.p6 GENE.NODE_892_length_1145_cov_16.184307_g620_i0~~NODE_892_length_1145_cov_16.184307_g620_i0.p6  ORF type:complete len:84 (-),score=36.61 NODE_892_length_1145_cov_16.184307_g620_i0:575-826(-)
MREEKLECGNEFGSEVQAAVSGTISSCVTSVSEKKEGMTTILGELLALRLAKYDGVNSVRMRRPSSVVGHGACCQAVSAVSIQ